MLVAKEMNNDERFCEEIGALCLMLIALKAVSFKSQFHYPFRNNQVKASRNRKTGTDDESKRVGSGGGGGIQQ